MLQRILTITLVTMLWIPAAAQSPDDTGSEPMLETLGWLAGHWRGEQNGRVTEEIWMEQAGGLMLGINRSVSSAGKSTFEYMRIAEHDGKISFHASPSGQPAAAFELKTCDEQRVVFENTEHDFPQRVIYRLDKQRLIGRIEGTINGQQRAKEWQFESAESKTSQGQGANEEKSMLKGLRTAVYKVEDIQQAKEWYSNVLGIEPYFDEPFYVGFNVGGYELGLDPDMESVTRGNNQPVYWGVDNCREAFAELQKRGAAKDSDPKDVGGGIIVATVRDPFGNLLGVIENPHFKLPDAK